MNKIKIDNERVADLGELHKELSELHKELDASKKSIEGHGESLAALEQKIALNIIGLVSSTEQRIASLRLEIETLQADLLHWTDPTQAFTETPIDSTYLEVYRERILRLKEEIKTLESLPVEVMAPVVIEAGKMADQIGEQMRKIDLTERFSKSADTFKAALTDLQTFVSTQLVDMSSKLLNDADVEKLSASLQTVDGNVERVMLTIGALSLKLKEMPDLNVVEGEEMSKNLEAIANLTNVLDELQKKVPLTGEELQMLKDNMTALEAQGKSSTEEYKSLKNAAVELQNIVIELKTAIEETNESLKGTSSSTSNLDQVINGVKTLITAYKILQDVTSLLGIENEALQKGFSKITTAMSILKGLQEIQIELKKKDGVVTTTLTILQRAYALAIGQTTGRLKLLRIAMLGTGVGALVVGIGMLIQYLTRYKDEQVKTVQSLDNLKSAQDTLSRSMSESSYTKVVQDLSALQVAVEMARSGFMSKKSVVEEYNKTIGKTTGTVKTMAEVEAFLVKSADNYVKMTMYKTAANLALADAAKEAVEAEKIQLKELSDFGSWVDEIQPQAPRDGKWQSQQEQVLETRQKRKDEEVKIHKNGEQKKLDISSKFLKMAQEIAQEMGFSIFDKVGDTKKTVVSADNALNSIVSSRENVFKKIDEIQKEFARKSMESDEAEIQAVIDKFAAINQVIKTENEKISSYNESNKNKKGFKSVDLIDTTQLKPVEKQAIEELTYTQGTKKLSKEIEDAKQLFADYEDYRSKLGKEKADERFKDDLKGFENFLQFITRLSDKEAEAHSAVESKTATVGQEERSKLILKEKDDAIRAEKQKQTEVLALLVTYDQQRKKLIDEHESNRIKYLSQNTELELAEFDRKHQEELNSLDDANIQKLQSVKDLFAGIESLTDSQARLLIQQIENILSADMNMSPEMFNQIKKALKDTSEALDNRLFDRLSKVSSEFQTISQSVAGFNEGLGTSLSVLGQMLQSTVQVKKGFDSLKGGINDYSKTKKEGGGGLLGSISGIAGIAGPAGQIISSVTSVVSGIVGVFKAAKESARKAAEEMKQYQESVLSGELEYNRVLRERAREQKNINDLTVEQIHLQQTLLEKQKEASNTDFDNLLKRVQKDGEKIVRQETKKSGGFLGIGKKTSVVDVTEGLSGYSYTQLEELYTQNKLTDATRKLFEELKKAKAEMDGLAKSWDDMQNELLDRMSGGVSANSLATYFLNGVKEGKREIKDFATYAEQVVQDAMLAAMSATVLQEPLMELVRKFREDAKDGLDGNEIEAFKKAYNDVVQDGLSAIKEIEKITGNTIGKDDGKDTGSIQGRVNRTVTEDTASAILGFERARYDLAKQQLNTVLEALDFDKKTHDQILEQVRYLKAIAQNTEDTVAELKNAVVELKQIKDNTNIKVER